jgi:hypothetical protein
MPQLTCTELRVSAFCHVERVYEPDPTTVEIYADLYEIHKSLVPALWKPWDARARFLEKVEKAEAEHAPLEAPTAAAREVAPVA